MKFVESRRYKNIALKFWGWWYSKWLFTNYVDKILDFFDHLLPCVVIFYGIYVNVDHLPTLYCKRSLWTPLNWKFCNMQSCGIFRPYLKASLKLGHGGLENQNVDIENTSCLSMTSSNVSLPVCRICQLPGVEPSNPLISPCRCLGSIRYVHNNCLLVSTYVPISSLGLPEFLKTFQLWWEVFTLLFLWL